MSSASAGRSRRNASSTAADVLRRKLVEVGIGRFLDAGSRPRAYPLAHDLRAVELGDDALIDDPRGRAQVPRRLGTLPIAYRWFTRCCGVRARRRPSHVGDLGVPAVVRAGDERLEPGLVDNTG